MTSFFVRYANSQEDLQKDLLRGYSFGGYMAFNSYESALEELQYINEHTEGDIKQHDNGSYGFALNGLCGFMSSDLEDARDFVKNHKGQYSFSSYPTCAIFEGEYVGDDPDGDLFKPLRIVEFHQEK